MKYTFQQVAHWRSVRLIVLVLAIASVNSSAHAQCPGDLTNSGSVNVFDLLELLACWGPENLPGCESADLNDDGMVTVFDLLELLAAWGDCPCVPNCENARCGNDGCGGTCGECPDGSLCEAGNCTCVPNCDGTTCGDDGCGGSCGECGEFMACEDGECVEAYGACCYPPNALCQNELEANCVSWAGNFIGHGTECDDGVWPSICNTCLNNCGAWNHAGSCWCRPSCSSGSISCCPDVCEQCGDIHDFAWCNE